MHGKKKKVAEKRLYLMYSLVSIIYLCVCVRGQIVFTV